MSFGLITNICICKTPLLGRMTFSLDTGPPQPPKKQPWNLGDFFSISYYEAVTKQKGVTMFQPWVPLPYLWHSKKRKNCGERWEKVKVATRARKETQSREKTKRKLTKHALGAAGDASGTRFTGPVQHISNLQRSNILKKYLHFLQVHAQIICKPVHRETGRTELQWGPWPSDGPAVCTCPPWWDAPPSLAAASCSSPKLFSHRAPVCCHCWSRPWG